MDIRLINTVILANDYWALVEWYKKTLDLEVKLEADKDYHYTDLAKNGQLIVGICPASEMGHSPTTPRNNSTLLQISTDDIHALFAKVKENSGAVQFGPSVDKNDGFTFGSFLDPEGNPVWVMENFNFN